MNSAVPDRNAERALSLFVVELRHQMELTQDELAMRLQISPRYLQELEHGAKHPSFTVMARLLATASPDAVLRFRERLEHCMTPSAAGPEPFLHPQPA